MNDTSQGLEQTSFTMDAPPRLDVAHVDSIFDVIFVQNVQAIALLAPGIFATSTDRTYDFAHMDRR